MASQNVIRAAQGVLAQITIARSMSNNPYQDVIQELIKLEECALRLVKEACGLDTEIAGLINDLKTRDNDS